MDLDPKTRETIDSAIKANKVCLFMKGSRMMPQCGFSATVVQILDELVPGGYETVNVLADQSIREGIKAYSSWPTIPQLYVNGEFVGGCDIIREMHASGELAKTLGVDLADIDPPTIEITAAAAEQLNAAVAEAGPGHHVRMSVRPNWDPALDLGEKSQADFAIEQHGTTLLVPKLQARKLDGAKIDFVQEAMGAGFKIDNPNAPPKVKAMTVQELQAKLAAGEQVELFDVRPEEERARASIAQAHPLDEAAVKHLESLDKDTPLVFHCHHGQRSFQAANAFLQKGFRNVYNLAGGIDEWSRAIDPNVPRY